MTRYYYRAADRRGRARSGVMFESPARFTGRLFRSGYRALTVTLGGLDGREVGRIYMEAGKRLWWAEDNDA